MEKRFHEDICSITSSEDGKSIEQIDVLSNALDPTIFSAESSGKKVDLRAVQLENEPEFMNSNDFGNTIELIFVFLKELSSIFIRFESG